MNQKSKIESYQKIYGYLKTLDKISELDYPDEKINLDFSCFVEDIKIFYSLSANIDLLSIRSDMYTSNMTNAELEKMAASISKDYNGMIYSGYNNHITFMIHVPCGGLGDEDAKVLLFDKAVEFITFMRDIILPMNIVIHHPDRKNIESTSEISNPLYHEINGTKISDDIEHTENETDCSNDDKIIKNTETNTQTDKMCSNEHCNTDNISESDSSGQNKAENKEAMKMSSNDEQNEVVEVSMEQTTENNELDFNEEYLYETFRIKKEQMDFRENMLNQQKELLNQERRMSEIAKAEAMELKKSLQDEKEAIDSRKKEIEKKEAQIKEKEKSLSQKASDIFNREKNLKQREQSVNYKSQNAEKKYRIAQQKNDENKRIIDEINKKTEEMREKESDLNKIKEEIDIREKKLSFREKQILIREQAITDKLNDIEEMEALIQEMKSAGIPIRESSELEAISQKDTRIRELEDALQKNREHAAKLLADAEKDITILNNELDELKDKLKNNIDPEVIAQKDAKIQELEQKIEKMNDSLHDENGKAVNVFFDSENDTVMLQNQIKQLEAERDEYICQIEKLKSVTSEESVSAKEQLEAAGYTLQLIQGEGTDRYKFMIEGCSVFLDENIHTFCIMKNVKRKYYKEVDKWNTDDFSESYTYSNGVVMCRKVYSNPIVDVLSPIQKFKNLK